MDPETMSRCIAARDLTFILGVWYRDITDPGTEKQRTEKQKFLLVLKETEVPASSETMLL